MKKAIFLILAVFLVSTFVVRNKTAKSGSSEALSKVPIASPQVAAPVAEVPSQSSVVKEKETQKDLFVNVPSMHQLEREYLGYKSFELQQELKASQKRIQDAGLLEKGQRDALSEKERVQLVFEIRRQGVLSHLLVSAKLKQLKEKYL